MSENPVDLLPELCVLGGVVVALLTGLFVPRGRQWLAVALGAAGAGAGLIAALVAAGRGDGMTFEAFLLDPVTHVTRVTVLGAALVVLALAAGPLRGHRRETEFTVLVLLAALGTILLGASADLLVLVAAYLLASIPAYVLAGFAKDARGTEAALKYYLMGALLGVLMLAGVTVLFGLGRGTSYATLSQNLAHAPPGAVTAGLVALLAGLLFKAGAVPAHHWVPDVTEGAPPVVAAFVTTVPKIGAFAALFRVATDVVPSSAPGPELFAVLAAATMTLGNLAAFAQTNVRRLLAYSTISQAGYLLVPVAVATRTDLAEPALLYYLAAYVVTNLGAFAVVLTTNTDTLTDYRALATRSPALAVSLAVLLLGLIGTPPTAVFVGKLLMFTAAIDAGYTWLAAVALANTVASVFYYLRWLTPVFTRPEDPPPPPRLHRPTILLTYTLATATLALGLLSGLTLLP
ncbi:NADH-quinone oxidoreductase subunit N [Actinomadura flavalba]|uniref:NADH-quinone oxidoreductase subunit N n=1 Tax=Actinomadura flavalba TaxID=1120938 RepID=UPI00036ABEFB|nr:NADH-quinone oxidoreductase subunit N [Actinomadura flavalba]